MSSVSITTTNDVEIANNDLRIVLGREEIAQILRQELRFFFAEWFLDTSKGLPWFERILVKNPDVGEVDALFKNKILASPGVIELLSFSLDLDVATRSLTLAFSARTVDGILNFDEVLS